MSFTSSLNYIERITQDPSGSLTLFGSGSTGRTDLFSIDGNNGRLFSVSDDLSDSLFSVNTIAGLPVIEAFADNTVKIGKYGAEAIVISGSNNTLQLSGSIKAVSLGTSADTNVVVFNTSTKALAYNTALSLQGTAGSQGQIGTSVQGTAGAQGQIGTSIQGQVGSQGQIGTSVQGQVGSQGQIGTSIQGQVGSQGQIGTSVQGQIGSQGQIGTSIQGQIGSQGQIGTSIQGQVGSQGQIGTSVQGTAGAQGVQGNIGPSTAINATNDTSTTLLYPVTVGAAGSNQTPKVRTTATAFSYNASTNALTATTFIGALSGNATTAATLQTARTLWGNNFDGANNVNGNLTSVGNITGTAAVILASTNERLTLTAGGANKISFTTNGSERWLISSAGILEAAGANTIRTATGQLTISTAGGNGNITIDPDGTGTTIVNSGGIYFPPQGTGVNGEIAYWGAGSVTAGNLYYFNSAGSWAGVDADTVSTSNGLLGIAQATGTASTVGMLLRGTARFGSNSFYTGVTTTGAPLYVSTTVEGFTQTAPSGTGDVVRVIGYVTSAANDEIYFNPDNTWVELA